MTGSNYSFDLVVEMETELSSGCEEQSVPLWLGQCMLLYIPLWPSITATFMRSISHSKTSM